MKISNTEIEKISKLSALKKQNKIWLTIHKLESIIDFISQLDWIHYNKDTKQKEDKLRLNNNKLENKITLENIKHTQTNNWINIKSSIK
jgi:Asp-tRNA(Asn)/Glu-tRNA(Gln) amidotransferase C subunit